MQLREAEELFKEIIDKCPSLHKKNFLIMLPEASPNNLTEGYEVIIKANPKVLDEETMDTLHQISANRKLGIILGSESIIFYSSSERAQKLKRTLAEWKLL